MSDFTEDDFAPGNECPLCGRVVATWMAKMVPDEPRDEIVEDGWCAISADRVEPTGLTSDFAGNVILIDHRGPSMEPGGIEWSKLTESD